MRGGHRAPKRISRGKLLGVAGALAALITAASMAVSPAQAEQATSSERERALAQLATCRAMRAEARTSAERAWADRCTRLAQRWVDRLSSPSPPATPTPVPSSPGTPTPTAAPTTPPPTTAAPSPSPTTPPNGCSGQRFPAAACTGVPAGWTPTRTVTGDLRVTTAGTVLDRVRVTGSVQVQAHNVRIVNSEIWGQVKNQYSGHIYDGLRVERSTLGPPTGVSRFTGGIIEGTGYTAIGNHMRNNVEGPRNGGFSYGGNQAGPVVLIGNYIRLRGVSGLCAHTDGLQGYDESNHAIVRNNTFVLTGISCTTAAIYIGFPFGADEVTDNLLFGGDSYVMRLEGTSSHFGVVRGNRLVRGSWSSALARVASCSTVGVWQDNRAATIAADGSVIDGPLLTNCPESTR